MNSYERAKSISKRIEQLHPLKKEKPLEILNRIHYEKSFTYITEQKEQDFVKVELVLMFVELMAKKTVDIWLIQNKKTVDDYNKMVDSSRWLDKREFEYLKELLQ